MAEAAGLVVGVVALAGLFNNTVECFEFTSQLKLDSARLRLSRWGKSLDLDKDDDSLVVYNPQKDLDPPIAKLHEKMRQLAIERQNQSSVRQKAKWALYQEKHFRRLIEDITELVDSLVELFLATQQVQRDLCDTEVSAIGENEGISVFLEQAITKTIDGADKSYHIVFSGSGNTSLQLGHNSGTMSGFTFRKGG
ncbi:hypothetical protein EK21DRAFT_105696 [Setomelanomma holmii]|uniref:Prion-inhibition and propagation HeLo domain-containing protein n=1 Tax=Setomelanomma holmii TaxID=210430 RepID=A0A9P4GV67_9PLEO|nr:hypothetical protein EK21DRAFT_105696 [Setomelanomma holmii]